MPNGMQISLKPEVMPFTYRTKPLTKALPMHDIQSTIAEEKQNSIHKDYLRYANKFDLLESEEEFILVENWKKSTPKSDRNIKSKSGNSRIGKTKNSGKTKIYGGYGGGKKRAFGNQKRDEPVRSV
jgi:hypothetical protein